MNLLNKVRRLLPTSLAPRDGVRIYGVGAAKTGTHSLGQMFADRVRAAHEQDSQKLIGLYLDALRSDDQSALRAFLVERDARHNLKIDASQVNIYLMDELLDIWPDSRFVLTIRPPMSWLRSIVDDSLRRDTSDVWMRFRDYRFSTPEPPGPEEAVLQDKGLYALSGYLGYWADSISKVTNRVPAEQLLIIKTEELQARSSKIAAFCGISGGAASEERSHAFANPERFGMLSEIPEDYLYRVAQDICGPAIAAHFPERDLKQDVADIRG